MDCLFHIGSTKEEIKNEISDLQAIMANQKRGAVCPGPQINLSSFAHSGKGLAGICKEEFIEKMKDLFGHDKIEEAIERLRMHEPPEGYLGATSFGKDSIVIMDLAKRAEVKVEWVYRVTTLDPPELIYFGRQFKNVKWIRPERPLLSEVIRKGFPTSSNRWCCANYKENFGHGRIIILGVRWAESKKREKRKFVEQCFKDSSKKYINPILDWKDKEIWAYIRENHLPYCSLYDEGFKRLGCIMCPKASLNHRLKEMYRWPKYEILWMNAFEELWKNKNHREAFTRWRSWQEMFIWWMSDQPSKGNPDQTVMFE